MLTFKEIKNFDKLSFQIQNNLELVFLILLYFKYSTKIK